MKNRLNHCSCYIKDGCRVCSLVNISHAWECVWACTCIYACDRNCELEFKKGCLSDIQPHYLQMHKNSRQQFYLQTAFLWLESLLGIIFTPLDFNSIAFFTAGRKQDGGYSSDYKSIIRLITLQLFLKVVIIFRVAIQICYACNCTPPPISNLQNSCRNWKLEHEKGDEIKRHRELGTKEEKNGENSKREKQH